MIILIHGDADHENSPQATHATVFVSQSAIQSSVVIHETLASPLTVHI